MVTPIEPAPAAGGAINDKIMASVKGCLAEPDAAKSFGFSLMYRAKIAGKTYFDGDNPTKAERTCISAAVKGMTADDAPEAGDYLYMIRINAQGMTIKSRALKTE